MDTPSDTLIIDVPNYEEFHRLTERMLILAQFTDKPLAFNITVGTL